MNNDSPGASWAELPQPIWDRYDRFNEAVAAEFFAGQYAGKPVYLDLEVDALSRIAAAAGEADADDAAAAFIDSVRPTLCLASDRRVFGRHQSRRAAWSASGRAGVPPHLAVLALLSLVAERMSNDGQFAANAYYSRSVEMIGGDPDNEALTKRVRWGHRQDVAAMWEELNDWILDDPARGFPTAQALDHRTYIGPALSQALVRGRDREALTDLFAAKRLSPRQQLSSEDMLALLGEWLPQARVSRTLKKVWKTTAARAQIAAVANAELALWDGTGRAAESMHTRGLRLAGRLRRMPRPSLELSLLARLPEGAATVTVGGQRERVELLSQTPSETSAVATLANHALTAVTSIDDGHSQPVVRVPRRIVVLKRDDHGLLSEVERVQLGVRHVLLAPEEARAILEVELTAIARIGWKPFSTLRGLPRGWIAIDNVDVVSLPTSGHPDMVSLTPVGWSHLGLSGGFRLPGRETWLQGSGPVASLAVLTGGKVDLTIELVAEQSAGADQDGTGLDGEDDEPPPSEDLEPINAAEKTFTLLRKSVGSLASLELDDELLLECGTYVVTAAGSDSGEQIDTRRFKIVAPHTSAIPTSGGHGGDPLWPLSATAQGTIRGAYVLDDLAAVSIFRDAPALPTALELEPIETSDEEPQAIPENKEPCFYSGGHKSVLPNNDPRKGVVARCEYCGMELWFPPKTRSREAALAAAVRMPSLPMQSLPPEQQVLSALSAHGQGSGGSLARIIDQIDDAPWALSERARTLSSLGHIDLTYDRRGRIQWWAIAPPVLARLRGGEGILCGWRSEHLLSQLQTLCSDLGGQMTVEAQEAAPDRLLIEGLSPEDLELVTLEVSDRIGCTLNYVERPSRTLAAALPAIRDLLDELPTVQGRDRLEWRQPGTWRWEPIDGFSQPGTYRTARLPREHYVFDGQIVRLCESSLARWIGVPGSFAHMAYDAATGTLTVPLGGRIPGLWERAAVLEAGCAPQRSGARVLYRNVSQTVADRLALTLASSTERIIVV